MARFDRYMLSQLLVLFGFFSLVLVLIYWINRAVGLFDAILGDGQSALVFLELTLLTLPGIIRIVIPLAGFAATIYVINRLSNDSELTVVQATGYSPFRLARPVLVFGLIVSLLGMVLTHILVPTALTILKDREAEIAQNMTARLLTAGEFTTPSAGTTFYIREITPEGELQNIFLSDIRSGMDLTYTATRAYLVRSDTGPQLVMLDGMVQSLNPETGRLTSTVFDDFAYDIGALLPETEARSRSIPELSTLELLAPTQALFDEVGGDRARFLASAHDRFAQALLGLVGPLLAFSALMIGSYSRFGMGRQIFFAIFLVVLVKLLESSGGTMAQSDARLWPMTYLATLAGLIMSAVLLWIASKPAILHRHRKGVPA